MRIAPPFLPPLHSGPATRNFQSSILVEALLWPTAPVLCHGPALWSPPSWSDGDTPTHAPLQQTSQKKKKRKLLLCLSNDVQAISKFISTQYLWCESRLVLALYILSPNLVPPRHQPWQRMQHILSSLVMTLCRNLNFLMVHIECREFQPSATLAFVLEYHLGSWRILLAISPWKHSSILMTCVHATIFQQRKCICVPDSSAGLQ